jgi:hypothetical protein
LVAARKGTPKRDFRIALAPVDGFKDPRVLVIRLVDAVEIGRCASGESERSASGRMDRASH